MNRSGPTREEIEAADGFGVRVLVIDSGLDLGHPVFAEQRIRCWRVVTRGRGLDVVESGSGDTIGHGTAVAGLIREHAPGVSIDSLGVIDADRGSSSERVLHALRWAVDRRYDVVNCSFGSKGTRFVGPYKRVVDLAFCADVLLVGACSNEPHQPTSFPACFPSVISTDRAELHGGDPLEIQRRPGQLVEFAMRGIDVLAPWVGGGTRSVSGSSFAAPHLAALVARIRSLRPRWNAVQVKASLYDLATVQVDDQFTGSFLTARGLYFPE